MNMDELKVTLTMLGVNWKDYWEYNRQRGDIIFCASIFREQPDLESLILNLLNKYNFKYKIREYKIADNNIIIYSKDKK
jgi:hypothetical protein